MHVQQSFSQCTFPLISSFFYDFVVTSGVTNAGGLSPGGGSSSEIVIIAATAGGGGFTLIVVIVMICCVVYLCKRKNGAQINGDKESGNVILMKKESNGMPNASIKPVDSVTKSDEKGKKIITDGGKKIESPSKNTELVKKFDVSKSSPSASITIDPKRCRGEYHKNSPAESTDKGKENLDKNLHNKHLHNPNTSWAVNGKQHSTAKSSINRNNDEGKEEKKEIPNSSHQLKSTQGPSGNRASNAIPIGAASGVTSAGNRRTSGAGMQPGKKTGNATKRTATSGGTSAVDKRAGGAGTQPEKKANNPQRPAPAPPQGGKQRSLTAIDIPKSRSRQNPNQSVR